jgi:NAD+ diphosphatase
VTPPWPASRPAPLRRERSAGTGFADHLFDRGADLRDDAGALARLAQNPRALWAVLAGDRPVLKALGEGRFTVWHATEEAAALGAERVRIWLGRGDEGAPRFAVALAPETAEPLALRPHLLVGDLRGLALRGLLPAEELGVAGTAKALADWHARHRFCARCGALTEPAQGGFRRDCAACGAQHFPRTDPVTIMLVCHGERCLLARQPRFPPGMFSAIAGFVEPGETIEDAVRRETFEETGLSVGAVRYLASQPWPFPSSLMIGCQAEAIDNTIRLDGQELEAARWFTRAEARALLSGSHPEGLTGPTQIAIAHTLLKAWVG